MAEENITQVTHTEETKRQNNDEVENIHKHISEYRDLREGDWTGWHL